MSTSSVEKALVRSPTHRAARPQRILIAVDDSEPSQWAVQVGGQLAQQLGARVLLLHVFTPRNAVFDIPITAEELDEETRTRGGDLLRHLGQLLPTSVTGDSMQLDGMPADEIVMAAQDSEVQLIVMGTRGAGRLSHFLLGSTAEAVIRQAPCPVLTVSHKPRRCEASTAAPEVVGTCQLG